MGWVGIIFKGSSLTSFRGRVTLASRILGRFGGFAVVAWFVGGCDKERRLSEWCLGAVLLRNIPTLTFVSRVRISVISSHFDIGSIHYKRNSRSLCECIQLARRGSRILHDATDRSSAFLQSSCGRDERERKQQACRWLHCSSAVKWMCGCVVVLAWEKWEWQQVSVGTLCISHAQKWNRKKCEGTRVRGGRQFLREFVPGNT